MRKLIAFCASLVCLALVAAPSFAEDSRAEPSPDRTVDEPTDFNREIYYKNKLELALDEGWLWYNTPLILDPLLGEGFHQYPGLPSYTLAPLIFSLRWHIYDISGRSFWRGNTDFTFGASYTAIVKGPESYYVPVIAGFRYNFVQPNWRIAPYFEMRGGMGFTDARQPWEVAHHQNNIGQGQDFTFTFMFGGGIRYNFNPRYSISLACTYMHISNLYLSEPRYFNHAVNVVGPSIGFNVALQRAALKDIFRAFGAAHTTQ